MTDTPLISVALPVFNTEKYVAEAIRSVLGQTYTNIEIICVDDGSTDGTVAVVESFGAKVRLMRNERNLGIAKTRNKAIRAAAGDFIAFMDADDIWESKKLEKQLALLRENPRASVAFCWIQCFLSPELPETVKQLRYCPPDPSPGYISGAALIRKEAFETIGLLDEQWRVGEFIDWFTRAKELGIESVMAEEVLYLRRIHETNTGVNERPSRLDYLRIARNAIHRRRHGEPPLP